EGSRRLRARGFVPLDKMLTADRRSPYYTREDQLHLFDATAWALVHYLMVGDKGSHQERLAQFVALSDKGEDSQEAARAKLGDPRQLEAALDGYVRNFAFTMATVNTSIEVSPKAFLPRKLSAAQALAMRAALHAATEPYRDASAALEDADPLGPDLAAAHESLALLAFEQKDLAAARRHMQEALKRDVSSVVALRVQALLDGSARNGRVFLGA